MKPSGHRISVILVSSIVIVAILLTGCGGTPTEAPPIVVGQNPSGNNGTYVNILINSLEFTGTVSNLGDTGNLQLIMVATDSSGHSDALVCPYGAVIQVHRGDKKNPCQAGLTYPSNLLKGNLNLMLIAVDVKDKSDLADIGTNLITSGLSTGLGAAIQGSAELSPELAIGLIALSTVIGYAGTKVQEYFQRNYVIGSQSFTLSSQYNWNNGQPVSAASSNQQVNFNFVVQQSSAASGQIVGAVPAQPSPTPTPIQASSGAPAQPSTNATVPSAGKLIYSDDFQDGFAHGFSFYQGTWNVVDDGTGNKVLEEHVSNGSSNSQFGPNYFTDGIVEFRFRVTSADYSADHHVAEFGFRNQASLSNIWTEYILTYDPQPPAGLDLTYQERSGPWVPMEGVNGGGSLPGSNTDWITVRTVVKGSNIWVFVNGNLFMSAYDTRDSAGGLYLGCWNLVTQYDDIKIWDLATP